MIVNARMYSVAPAAKAAWRELLEWVLEQANLRMEFVDQESPATLADLWVRNDLGAAMMCGLPYSHRKPKPILLAAPVPSPERYADRAVYFTDIAVRADAPFAKLEDTFGHTIGYTLTDSMSGCVALRQHLLPLRKPGGEPLYRKVAGGLVNARGIIQALIDGRIDVGPLDSYVHELLRLTEPGLAAQLRVVGVTAPTTMPPLVAAPGIAPAEVARLREALCATAQASGLAEVCATLGLRRFVPMAAERYQRLQDDAREADALGYRYLA